MKRLILILSLLTLFTGVAAARDPETLKVKLGQSKAVQNGRVSVRFNAIVEDSRCPMNARCIHAGNAKVRMTVFRGRSSKKIVLDSTDGTTSIEVFGYRIEFVDLNPQKGAPRPMSLRPQTLTVSVERAGS